MLQLVKTQWEIMDEFFVCFLPWRFPWPWGYVDGDVFQMEVSEKGGTQWMVYVMENPNLKWMMAWGHHPFLDGIFQNRPTTLGYTHLRTPPYGGFVSQKHIPKFHPFVFGISVGFSMNWPSFWGDSPLMETLKCLQPAKQNTKWLPKYVGNLLVSMVKFKHIQKWESDQRHKHPNYILQVPLWVSSGICRPIAEPISRPCCRT